MSTGNKRPGLIESLVHGIQVWVLTRRFCLISFLLYPIVKLFNFIQGVKANNGDYLYHKLVVFGENFCCAGGVWLCSFENVKTNLLEPQARTYKLASSNLDPDHLPHMNLTGDGRLTFLLSLSQKGAGGNGDWEAYRSAFQDTITDSGEAKKRLGDYVTKELLEKLAEEYRELRDSPEFFENNGRALHDFLLKYLHYVLFGIDPNDEEKIQALNKLHYDCSSAGYYLKRFGNMLECLMFRTWPKKMKEAAKIYEESPALQKFDEGHAKYNHMTRYELANLALSIMSLAGMVGPKTLAYIVLGHTKLVDYEGKDTAKIDVKSIWDKLNLTDRNEVLRYIHECGRLRNPVSNTHKVATEEFTVNIRGMDRTFPKGTVIFIPMLLGGVDKRVWGDSTFEFNHNRENLCPFSMMFHSFGEETNGRICPGKKISEEMMTDVLIALGEERQKATGFKISNACCGGNLLLEQALGFE